MSATTESILKDAESKLRAAHISAEDASILIAHILGIEKAKLFAHPDDTISPEQYIEIQKSLNKRIAGYSVAAITGHKEFYGLDFIVNADTLIPRPDTEVVVDAALEYLKKSDHQTVLDMGTGSGCIIIALAKQLPQHTHTTFSGTDISEKALTVARENARRLGVSVHFTRSNLFDTQGDARYTLIVANLPYLTTDQLREPSIKHEPVGALWGGSDGLDIYRTFFEQAKVHVAERFCILIEIDPRQKESVQKIAQGTFPEAHTSALPDLAGHDRVIKILV